VTAAEIEEDTPPGWPGAAGAGRLCSTMTFTTLALLTAVGLAGPLLAAVPRLGTPLVVGEIAAGLVVGRSGLDLVPVDDPALTLLADLGFALLMLIVGTHLPLRRPDLRPAVGRAALAAGVTATAAAAGGVLLARTVGPDRPAVLAVLLATSSAAVALLVLFVLAAVATRAHTSVLLAGFAAGTVLALLGEPRRLAQQLIGLGEGFLVPIFFVTLGARLRLGALLSSPSALGLAGVLALGALAVHLLTAISVGLPPAAGLVATAQIGVPAAIASVGLRTGALGPGQAAAVLAAALASLGACAAGSASLARREVRGGDVKQPTGPSRSDRV